jgi:hypothetical protein
VFSLKDVPPASAKPETEWHMSFAFDHGKSNR